MKHILLIVAMIGLYGLGYCQYVKFSSVSPSGHTLSYEINSAGTIPGGGAWVTCENDHFSVHYSSTTPAYNNMQGHVVIPDSVEYNGSKYAVTAVGDCAFTRCADITSVTLPQHIVHLFEGCTKLSTITIPENIVEIGNNAFKHCDSLHTVYFNAINCANGTWGNDIFRESNNINAVYVGANVTHMPSFMFAACNQLPDIYFSSDTPPTMVTNVFPGDKNITAHVPCNVLDDYTSALTGQDGAVFTFQCLATLAFEITINSNDNAWGSGSHVALSDSIAEISATANHGYHFDHWSFGSTANPDTIMLSDDVTITAIFAKNQYSVTGITNDSTKGSVSGSATVDYLDSVTLTATAFYGYQFVRWNDYSITNPRRIAATNNITKTAIFDLMQFNLNAQADSSVHGTCLGSGSYNYQTVVTVRANANYGYHFTQWSDGDTNNPRVITMTQDTSLIAMFAKNQYTLSVSCNDTAWGTVGGDGLYEYLDTAEINAVANGHFHFVRWDDGNTLNPRRVIITGDISRTAIFATDSHHVTLQAGDIAHGTCSGGGDYQYGTAATVEATPFSGYQFSHWSDGSIYNPYTFAVLADTVLTAYYVAVGEPWQDTVFITLHETVYVTSIDTLWQTDTVYIHDTIYIPTEGIGDALTTTAKIYQRDGQVVVEGVQGEGVTLFDAVGRQLAVRRDEGKGRVTLYVPSTGAYLVNPSSIIKGKYTRYRIWSNRNPSPRESTQRTV